MGPGLACVARVSLASTGAKGLPLPPGLRGDAGGGRTTLRRAHHCQLAGGLVGSILPGCRTHFQQEGE